MAIRMQQDQIGQLVLASFRPFDYVVKMPPSISRDLLIADRALTFLPPPQPAKLATSFERLVHSLCKPFGKVAVVRWIVRIHFRLDLDVGPFPVSHQDR